MIWKPAYKILNFLSLSLSLSLSHTHTHTHAFNGIPKYSLIKPHKTNLRKSKSRLIRYKRFSEVLWSRPGTHWREVWGNEVQHIALNVNKISWICHRVNHLPHSLCICFVCAQSIEDIFTGLFYLQWHTRNCSINTHFIPVSLSLSSSFKNVGHCRTGHMPGQHTSRVEIWTSGSFFLTKLH
jgi:hypothetical protein